MISAAVLSSVYLRPPGFPVPDDERPDSPFRVSKHVKHAATNEAFHEFGSLPGAETRTTSESDDESVSGEAGMPLYALDGKEGTEKAQLLGREVEKDTADSVSQCSPSDRDYADNAKVMHVFCCQFTMNWPCFPASFPCCV